MNKSTKAAIGAGVLAAGLGAGALFLGEDEQQLTGNRVVISAGGKYVRVVTKADLTNQPEVATELGKAALLQPGELPGDAQCFVVIDAPMKKADNGQESLKPLPYLPGLEGSYYPGTLPELINGSEENNSYLWAVMLKGQGCSAVADYAGYAGSDMHQFLLSSAKHRMLKTKRKHPCAEKHNGKDEPCNNLVSVSDPDADLDAEIAPPVAILGRDDLNWVSAEKGKAKERKQVFATTK